MQIYEMQYPCAMPSSHFLLLTQLSRLIDAPMSWCLSLNMLLPQVCSPVVVRAFPLNDIY